MLFKEVENGVSLEFTNSEVACPSVSGTYGLKITAFCDKTLSSGQMRDVKWDRNTRGTCVQEVSMYSRDACPAFDANSLWAFAEEYKFVWGAIYVVIGLFVNFFGRVMIKPTTFFLSFVVLTFVQLFVLYSLFM